MPSEDIWKFIWSWAKWIVKVIHMLIGCLFPFGSLREGLTYLQREDLFCYSNLQNNTRRPHETRCLVSLLSAVYKVNLNWRVSRNILGQSLCETTDEIGIDIVSDRLYCACAIMVIAVITWVAIFNMKRKQEVKKVDDEAQAGLNNDQTRLLSSHTQVFFVHAKLTAMVRHFTHRLRVTQCF